MSAKKRIIEYLKEHLGKWVHNQKLREFSGANDTPRTIRALKQEGWQIEVDGKGNNRLLSIKKGEARGKREAISRKKRFQILQRDDFRCKACGRSTEDGVKLVIDHMLPINWGGTNEESNLQVLCEECNSGKQAWVKGNPPDKMKTILAKPSIEKRIEALFTFFPNKEIPSTMIQFISKGSLDWQRALRKVRERTGMKITPAKGRKGYIYL